MYRVAPSSKSSREIGRTSESELLRELRTSSTKFSFASFATLLFN
jgi:hypothetical protein